MKRYSYLLLILLGVCIGLLITAQFKAKPTRILNPLTPYASLKDARDSLVIKHNNYKNLIAKLNDEIEELQSSDKTNKSENKLKLEQWKLLRQDIGLTDISAEGVVVTMDDSDNENPQIDSITHAADLRDVVNLAWASGAKAISINGERIIFNTSIDCIINTILINNVKLTPPFKILIIGDVNNLKRALDDQNILSELHLRVKNEGLVFLVEKTRSVTILGYKGNYTINYAKSIQ